MIAPSSVGAVASWAPGDLPSNVSLGPHSLILKRAGKDPAFQRFRSQRQPALVIGAHCTMDSVLFNLGEEGQVRIGDYAYFQDVILLCAQEIEIGRHVFIGWQTTLSDADFHPIAAAERMADAVACSPGGLRSDEPRRPFGAKPIRIEDDVYIGPLAVILKGVRIGAGAIIEPGAVILRDVPPGARMLGNPAQQIGTIDHGAST